MYRSVFEISSSTRSFRCLRGFKILWIVIMFGLVRKTKPAGPIRASVMG